MDDGNFWGFHATWPRIKTKFNRLLGDIAIATGWMVLMESITRSAEFANICQRMPVPPNLLRTVHLHLSAVVPMLRKQYASAQRIGRMMGLVHGAPTMIDQDVYLIVVPQPTDSAVKDQLKTTRNITRRLELVCDIILMASKLDATWQERTQDLKAALDQKLEDGEMKGGDDYDAALQAALDNDMAWSSARQKMDKTVDKLESLADQGEEVAALAAWLESLEMGMEMGMTERQFLHAIHDPQGGSRPDPWIPWREELVVEEEELDLLVRAYLPTTGYCKTPTAYFEDATNLILPECPKPTVLYPIWCAAVVRHQAARLQAHFVLRAIVADKDMPAHMKKGEEIARALLRADMKYKIIAGNIPVNQMLVAGAHRNIITMETVVAPSVQKHNKICEILGRIWRVNDELEYPQDDDALKVSQAAREALELEFRVAGGWGNADDQARAVGLGTVGIGDLAMAAWGCMERD